MTLITDKEIEEAERREIEEAKKRLLSQNAGISRKNKNFKEDVDLTMFNDWLYQSKKDKKYQYIIMVLLVTLIAGTIMVFFFQQKFVNESTNAPTSAVENSQ